MKIYTQTGDDGTTGLIGGGRVPKNDSRLDAYGTVDELNSTLGVVRSSEISEKSDDILDQLQHQLFELGAELATPDPNAKTVGSIQDEHVSQVEAWIDELEAELAPLTNFILPGGTAAAAGLHLARCVCRRAEREMATLASAAPLRSVLLKYVNRVSDLLFVMARTANREAGVDDVPWKKNAES